VLPPGEQKRPTCTSQGSADLPAATPSPVSHSARGVCRGRLPGGAGAVLRGEDGSDTAVPPREEHVVECYRARRRVRLARHPAAMHRGGLRPGVGPSVQFESAKTRHESANTASLLNDGSFIPNHSSLKERAGVKRGFGLRFGVCGGVCKAWRNGPVAPPFSGRVPCSCGRAPTACVGNPGSECMSGIGPIARRILMPRYLSAVK